MKALYAVIVVASMLFIATPAESQAAGFQRGQPLRNVVRFVVGTERRERRASRRASGRQFRPLRALFGGLAGGSCR